MANRDGTGPNGAGSGTGRGLGICADINAERNGTGLRNRFSHRRGFGQGSGRDVQLHKETFTRESNLLHK